MNFVYFALIAGVLFTISNFLIKLSGIFGLEEKTVVLFMGIGYVSLSLFFVFPLFKGLSLSKSLFLPLAAGMLMLGGTLTLFTCLKLAGKSFGVAITITQVSVVLVSLVLGFLIGERITALRFFGIILSIIGVILISLV